MNCINVERLRSLLARVVTWKATPRHDRSWNKRRVGESLNLQVRATLPWSQRKLALSILQLYCCSSVRLLFLPMLATRAGCAWQIKRKYIVSKYNLRERVGWPVEGGIMRHSSSAIFRLFCGHRPPQCNIYTNLCCSHTHTTAAELWAGLSICVTRATIALVLNMPKK